MRLQQEICHNSALRCNAPLPQGGAGVHPGGGVMGAPGRNVARVIMDDLM